MKHFSTLIVALFLTSYVISQSCLPDGIYLSSQAEIDNFKANYPNCTEIEGFVEISGDGITNLDSLHLITSVGGYVDIYSVPNLTDIDGLSSLKTVGTGRFGIHGTALVNLEGLGSLVSVPGLRIEENPLLNNLEGLDALHTASDGLYIIGNPSLSNLNGIENITSLGDGGTLIIEENDNLTSLSGIDNAIFNPLYQIEIWIRDNPMLSECEVKSICNLLEDEGIIYVSNNAVGCATIDEVRSACETSVGELDQGTGLSIYPNPANSTITIEVSAHNTASLSMTITGINGQRLIAREISEPQATIDISQLPQGVYFVKVRSDKKVMVRKVIKE